MRGILVSTVFAIICFQSALAQTKTFYEPVLDPGGVTAEQAALDLACERRSQLPGAVPAPESAAIAATGRASIDGERLLVGRFTLDAAAADPEHYGYSYAGRYAAAEVDIVKVEDFDSIGWLVADQKAGILRIPRLLIPSPDGQVWATSRDFEAPDGEILIYGRDDNEWKLLDQLPIALACDLHWRSNDVLAFRTTATRYSAPGPEQLLVRRGYFWALEME